MRKETNICPTAFLLKQMATITQTGRAVTWRATVDRRWLAVGSPVNALRNVNLQLMSTHMKGPER